LNPSNVAMSASDEPPALAHEAVAMAAGEEQEQEEEGPHPTEELAEDGGEEEGHGAETGARQAGPEDEEVVMTQRDRERRAANIASMLGGK